MTECAGMNVRYHGSLLRDTTTTLIEADPPQHRGGATRLETLY